MANDLKFQVYRGDAGPEKWDLTGDNFIGSPEDEHATWGEVENIDEDLERVLTDPESLGQIIEPGDNALVVFNRIGAILTAQSPKWVENLATLLGLDGDGPVKIAARLYTE